ncbi:MAG TPA: hypothetical protein VGH98_20145 [Gemmatimonadaceae bacterium]|jgi:hypothetical protein
MILRRLKAIVVTAGIWAAAWLPLGFLYGLLVFWQSRPSDALLDKTVDPWPIIGRMMIVWTLWGAVVGAMFALGVLVAERRRSLGELSAWRFGILGGLAAAMLPVYFFVESVRHEGHPRPRFIVVIALVVLYGAATAVAMLRSARAGVTSVDRQPA